MVSAESGSMKSIEKISFSNCIRVILIQKNDNDKGNIDCIGYKDLYDDEDKTLCNLLFYVVYVFKIVKLFKFRVKI